MGLGRNFFANVLNDLRERRLQPRCELLSVSKRFAGNRDNLCDGTDLEDGLHVGEQAPWCEMMGKRVAIGRAELERFAVPTSWLPVVGGVDEDNEIGSTDRLCQLGCQLVERENLNRFVPEQFGETPGSPPAETIVGTKRITVSDDQYAPHINSF